MVVAHSDRGAARWRRRRAAEMWRRRACVARVCKVRVAAEG
jgi:hypothetical protein